MYEKDGGDAAETVAENRRVEEAAAGRAAELSVVSNPSISDPAISQGGVSGAGRPICWRARDAESLE